MRTAFLLTAAALLLTAGTFGLRAKAADSLAVGATAPNFTLPSQDNTPVSLSEFKGKWVVLYFYPKDKTTGCTIEAHNFQRDLDKYTALNAAVLGVSLDTADSHKSFCTQESLTFKLLADPDHKVVDLYGVPVRGMGPVKFASRQTYLISPEGKIVKFWPDVKVDHHSEEVLAEIAAHK
ncbi:MAG: peroxiredoxin [Acidobacteriota bacterium]|nr:peroxiredoxin [Acidobacteriota bacterium]